MTTLDKLKSIAEKSGREFDLYFCVDDNGTIYPYDASICENKNRWSKDCKWAEPNAHVIDIETSDSLRSALRVAIAQLEIYEWAIEFYSYRENWIFSKSLPNPHIGIERMTITASDIDIGLLCEGNHDDVGGKRARQAKLDAEKLGENL